MKMRHAVMMDFGSTYTKVVLVDIRERQVLLTDRYPSTVHTNAGICMQQCFDAVKRVITREEFEDALKLSSSSAAGGLRMAVIGLTENLSIAAGRDAVFGAGAKIMGTFHGRLDGRKTAELEKMDLEIILLCGGYENGNVTMIRNNAEVLARSDIHVPVVYSGNQKMAKEVRRILAGGKKECFLIDNIMPAVGVLNVNPSREIIRNLFMQRITNMKGLSCVKESLGNILMPTPAAVLAAGELLSRGTDSQEGMGNLMMVDVGGATTDIYSFNVNKAFDHARIIGVNEPFSKRTVEGDMGMRESSGCLSREKKEEELAREAGISKEEWNSGIRRRMLETDFLADSEKEHRIDHTIACNAVSISARRHAGKLEYSGYGKDNLIQKGKNLTDIRTVIGTGGPVINSRDPAQILCQVEKKEKSDYGILLPQEIEPYVDDMYVFFAAGLLSSFDREAAFEIMKKSIRNCKRTF